MMEQWIGAVLIVTGCGGFGFAMAAAHREREQILKQLLRVLQFMAWELQYRLTPLPELCAMAAKEGKGLVSQILLALGRELEQQVQPDAAGCMEAVLNRREELPKPVRFLLRRLGMSLGRFDLPGQLEGLEDLEGACRKELARMEENRDQRLRSYGTLGLCAGAALVILFI